MIKFLIKFIVLTLITAGAMAVFAAAVNWPMACVIGFVLSLMTGVGGDGFFDFDFDICDGGGGDSGGGGDD